MLTTVDIVVELAQEHGWQIDRVPELRPRAGQDHEIDKYWITLCKGNARLDCHARDNLVWISRENKILPFGGTTHGPEIYANLSKPNSIDLIIKYFTKVDPTINLGD